jgi:hypothetical protein
MKNKKFLWLYIVIIILTLFSLVRLLFEPIYSVVGGVEQFQE